MIAVTLYSRKDCHLCEQTKADLHDLQEIFPHRLIVVDVDNDQELQHKYGSDVPVLEIGPYTLKAPISLQELKMTLGAALDRERHMQMVENSPALEEVRQRATWTGSDRFTYWMGRHYLAMFNLLVLIYVGLPFLAPVLMKVGAQAPAGLIYRAYGLVCHQLAYRSFFLFGVQPNYPRAAAGEKGGLNFNQATGLSEGSDANSIYQAEKYIGDELLGFKVALCERDVAIYGGILLFGLLFSVTRRHIPVLPWYIWILVGLVPIGLDGGTQLISQPPLSFLPFRESTSLLRVITGGLFGFTTAWFGYKMVEETMIETRQIMEAKHRRIFDH
jgi:uncharacterized membrane protein